MDIKNNYPDYVEKVFEFHLPPNKVPERLDVFLTENIRNATRSKVQKAIAEGTVLINNKIAKANKKIQPGDHIICKIMKPPPIELVPENIPLEIKYEDEYLMVVNKPQGMVTHPGFGNRYGTLVNAVLYHLGIRDAIQIEGKDDEEEVADEGMIFASDEIRPGVVHRLDKDTSGLLVISKNPVIHAKLAEQFADRTIARYYFALVWGKFEEDEGTYTGDIGRSQRDRKLFAVVKKDGKPSITDYKVIERFDYLTLVRIKLRTGRTHQIRVHFSHNHHPVFGDKDYGGDKVVAGFNNQRFRKRAEELLKKINRQMLHAKTLGFTHPVSNEFIEFDSEIPDDFANILKQLKTFSELISED